MRIYKENEKGEKMYRLECRSLECICSQDSVTTVVWLKEYLYNLYCEKCGERLIETNDNLKFIQT